MEEISSTLTVYFDDPFWAAICERSSGGKLEAAKIIFGAEPKDYEVYAYFLTRKPVFSPAVLEKPRKKTPANPKRAQRAARQQMSSGVGTKAQQALALQYAQNKLERKKARRQDAEEERERQFALRQRKKKEKHRGR